MKGGPRIEHQINYNKAKTFTGFTMYTIATFAHQTFTLQSQIHIGTYVQTNT